MKINNLILALVVMVCATGAAYAGGSSTSVSGSGSAGLWSTQTQFAGKFSSGASSSTSGGSQATTGVNGNGWSFQQTWNTGDGFAGAGGKVSSSGVNTWTNGGSKSAGSSFGADNGNLKGFQNNTAGGVATNYTSSASGSLESFSSGKAWNAGGFFAGTFSTKTKHRHSSGY